MNKIAPRSLSAIVYSAAALFSVLSAAYAATPQLGDTVIRNALVYDSSTGDAPLRSVVIRAGTIAFIGTAFEADAWTGRETKTEDAGGRLLLPGLVDAHIHPTDIVELDICDLKTQRKTLAQLSAVVKACVEHFHPVPGQWFNVWQWNSSIGNEPDARYPTLRAALDGASRDVPIQLNDSDGHHSAFNTTALALAKNGKGQVVGFTKATLATDFAPDASLVGVDAQGEPNGVVGEHARSALGLGFMYSADPDQIMKMPEKIAQRLNSAGITAVLDAAALPEALPLYDALWNSKHFTFRATLAQYYMPESWRKPDGSIDYDRMLSMAKTTRAKYAGHPVIRANVVKLFADGVLEGNPFAVPPTLGNGAVLKPLLQPIFGRDRKGRLTVTGYVDTRSPVCNEVRAAPKKYAPTEMALAFLKANGFHPGQCEESDGRLEHDRAVIFEFVKRFHQAGFALHVHVIGDRAVRTAVDAIEAARASDGVMTPDALAHVQLVHPDDVARIGRDHLYLAMTYSWEETDRDYDMTVVPFRDRVIGNGLNALHPANGYYEQNAYPTRSLKDAGAILVAGSDAPVVTRDPRPFVNMAQAITRRSPGERALNPSQAISLRDVLDAYTINGARYLGLEGEAGSIAVGKSADLILVDQNILEFAEPARADDIAKTHVLATWFKGEKVYRAPVH